MVKPDPDAWLVACYKDAPYPAFRMIRFSPGLSITQNIASNLMFPTGCPIGHADIRVYSAKMFISCDWTRLPILPTNATTVFVPCVIPDIIAALTAARAANLFAQRAEDDIASLI